MRKYMTKEVQFTLVKSAKMELVAGMPKAVPMEDMTILGKLSQEKAQREVQEKYGSNAMVYLINHFTKVYKMSVEEFVQLAEEVNPDENDNGFSDNNEDEDDEEEGA